MNLIDWHIFSAEFQRVAANVLAAAAVASIPMAWKWVKHQADSIKDARIRNLALLAVKAIQQETGSLDAPEKKQAAVERLKALFPRLPENLASDAIEAAVFTMRQEEKKPVVAVAPIPAAVLGTPEKGRRAGDVRLADPVETEGGEVRSLDVPPTGGG